MSGRVVTLAVSGCILVSMYAAGEAWESPVRSHRASNSGDAFMVDTGVTLIPAAGSQCSYSVASNGDGWRVMWGYDYSVYTNGIGTDGSLLDAWGGLVGHDSYMRGGLTRSMVGIGLGFIAVWTSRSSPSRIWASRLDSAGALVDSLPVFEGDSNQAWPAVAFDGDSTCLVVWTVSRGSDRDVYAARLTTSGQVLDTNPLPVAHDPLRREAYPTAAFGQGAYLVAWTVYDSAWARPKAKAISVSADGVVLDTAIFLRHDPAATQERPSIAFGDTCFLAAWSEGTSRPDVYAARVSLSGNLIDTAGIQLSSSPFRDRYPSVGFDGTRFLVMWQEGDTIVSTIGTVCGRRVTVDGVSLDSSLIRPSPSHHSCTYPSVAADQANFLVAFCDFDSLTYDDNVRCVRISPDGAVLDSGIVFPLGADAQGIPSGASDGTDFLAVWTETRAQDKTIVQAARIASGGSLLDPIGFTVNDEPGSKSNVAAGFGNSLFLVAWADNRSSSGDIYCARVSLAGQVLDTDGIVVCDESLSQANPDISFDGQNFLLVWFDYRSGIDGDVYAARVSPDGVVLDPGGFAVDADTLEDAMPVVCFADTSYLVVWAEGPSWQGPYDIYGALVSCDGVVTRPRFLVSGATGNQTDPAVANGPTGALIVWQDSREPTTATDICGARVSADGTVLDSNGLTIAATSYSEKSPRVTSDDAGFRVLWNHRTPAGGAVFTTGRVDTTGVVSHVGDWFAITLPGPDISVGYDAVYGRGPELLLLFSFWTDTALGRHYGSHRLWGRLGDVPGIEQANNKQLRIVTGGASIVRGALLLPEATSHKPQATNLLDAAGRKVMELRSGANDVSALSPGVYFVREAQAHVHAQSVEKVIIAR